MKTYRGGKRNGDIITSKNQKTRGREADKSDDKHRTYKFYNAKLGVKQIPGPRADAIKKARELGYKESELADVE